MSKMYVYNVPADQTVRIRSTPSSKGKILVMFPLAVKLKPLLRMLTAGITPNTKPIRAI